MRIYEIDADYLKFLKFFDAKVPNVSGINYKHQKVYLGVVLQLDNHKFYAPLSSQKAKFDSISDNSCSIFKIYHKNKHSNKKLGAVLLNNMLPVSDEYIKVCDFSQFNNDILYKNLLENQYRYILKNQEVIKNKAQTLYNFVVNKKNNFYMKISTDIPTLLNNYQKYKKS